ncbi:hypothetical protein C5Y93_18925 [Blastopirellula marina]|uniref:Uncharacterized protein n=1 Tax=Blastopirellula marina TaxID=124 RepID=A0A2S8GJ58_9BACT|nr:hypothetical protein C5Y93_18925 [Blastopirellula marina]
MLGVILVYVFAVRPSEEHLHELNVRVSRLDRTMQKLTRATDTIDGTVDLLTQLERQKELTDQVKVVAEMNEKLKAQFCRLSAMSLDIHEAEVTLDRITSLHHRVADHYPVALKAEQTFNQAANLQSQILLSGNDFRRADVALTDLLHMQKQIVQQSDSARMADQVLSNILAMQNDLVANQNRTQKARLVADNMIQIEADLICQMGDSQFAVQSLEQLLTMQKQLNRAGNTMEDGQSILGELLAQERNLKPSSSPSSQVDPWKVIQTVVSQTLPKQVLPINSQELFRLANRLTQDAPPYVADLVAPAASEVR